MNTMTALTAALLLACLSPARADTADLESNEAFVALGDGGVYAAGTFPSAGHWLALHCERDYCYLSESDVAVGLGSATGILEEAEPTDVVHASGHPIALFSGLPMLSNPLITLQLGPPDGLVSPLQAGTEAGELPLALGNPALRWLWQRTAEGSFEHYLSDGQRSQLLLVANAEGHYGGDASLPELHWVGDIDADGKVDLLLSLPSDSCDYDVRLYLSSQAQGDEWVHLAAQLSGNWPACGC